MILGKKLLLVIGAGLLSFTTTKQYNIKVVEAESTINLHLASKDITGSINGLTTSTNFDPENLHTSWIKAEVSTETFSTGNVIRDLKLLSKKYLNKKKHEKITFKSTKIVEMDHGYIVTGMLTIKEVTKSMSFDLVYSEGIVAGIGSINLMDFKINMSEKRNENKLDIYLNIRVIKEENSVVEN